MSNVDAEEIQKFEKLASRWWDPNGEFKPLHAINPLRLAYIDERAPLPGKRVLDVGCGGGLLTEEMSSLGAQVTGIDKGEAPLAVARLHLLESGRQVAYHPASAEEWAVEHAGAYDVVTCLELLEHVPDPASTVEACSRLVAPGGAVFFSTINRNPKSYLFAVIGAEYVLKLLPRGTHDYQRFIKPSELSRWSRAAGLTADEVIGMTYHPIAKRYALGRDCDVNYLLRCSRDA
jgi:2-polyprenyl-6-hydroxyphenyl methylase/3-demethylubiquinone-9 3-methyltransferase